MKVVTYLEILTKERNTAFKNGLYDYIAVSMSYNTNKIEGSTLTFTDTKSLYEKDIVFTGGHKTDDVIEGRNHFKLLEFMFETIEEPLSERLIKEYHQLLKSGTSDVEKYGIGQYKVFPNIVGDTPVAEPHEVPEKMQRLINSYQNLHDVILEDILSFHYHFETIHPFQDGNGRVGRVIMLRECLRHNITPFIISAERREEYIQGLKSFPQDPSFLQKEANLQQEVFEKMAAPFLKYYQNAALKKRDNERDL